jgi:hypothetical protein
MLFGKTAITFAYELGLRKIFLHMKFNPTGIFAEIRFPKKSLDDGVSGVQSLDVVAPNLFLQDHV